MRKIQAILPAVAVLGVFLLTALGKLPGEACITFLVGLFLTPPHQVVTATPRGSREISVVK